MLEQGQISSMGSVSATIDNYLDGVAAFHTSRFEFTVFPRQGDYGSQLLISRVCFNGGSGIWHGAPLQVEMSFKCCTDVFDVSFGVGFCNRDGVRVVTIDSDSQGKRFNLRRGEKGIVSFLLNEFHLAPDTYFLDVGARSGDTFGLDYLPQAGLVFVAPGDKTPSSILLRDSVSGGYRPITQWYLQIE
jgi:hypothetical protein